MIEQSFNAYAEARLTIGPLFDCLAFPTSRTDS
jgi:hypothetical protein